VQPFLRKDSQPGSPVPEFLTLLTVYSVNRYQFRLDGDIFRCEQFVLGLLHFHIASVFEFGETDFWFSETDSEFGRVLGRAVLRLLLSFIISII